MNNGGPKGDSLHGAPPPAPAASGGNGHGTHLAVVDARLSAVESRMEKVDSRLAAVEGRLVAVETRLAALATKEDIQMLQNAMLRWGIGILGSALASVLFMAYRMSAG